MQKLNVLQWNARSAIANKGNLEICLKKHNINLALICETWFKPGSVVKFSGYNVIRKDRRDGKSGVAILIENQIPYNELNNIYSIPGVITTAIDIPMNKNKRLSIVCLYNSPTNKISYSEWEKMIKSIKKPFIIAGDFNVHVHEFGSSQTDSKGRILLDVVHDNNIVYLNDGSATLVNRVNQINKSAIDVTFCSTDIAANFNWTVLDDPMGSNHLPIKFSSHNKFINYVNNKSFYKWKITGADWNKFRNAFDSDTDTERIINYEYFTSILNRACSASIPQYKAHNSPFNTRRKCWWTSECTEGIAKRQAAYKNYIHSPSRETFIEYKKYSALARRIIKVAKEESWREFCRKLNKNYPLQLIWKKIKSIQNVSSVMSPMEIGSWTDEFIDRLAPPYVENQINLESSEGTSHALLEPLNMHEFNVALKSNTNTAPGLDQINYSMLVNLPKNLKHGLLKLYNQMLDKGEFPPEWEDYIICPILKNNKPKDQSTSYRPIALSSCVLKTLERMLKNRLEWWLEHYDKLPKTQFGFRKGKSVYDGQVRLVIDIQQAFTSNKHVAGLFLDFASAYDNVQIPILFRKLTDIGIPRKFAGNIIRLIKNRNIYIKINDTLIGPKVSHVGLPQGGILSPLLYAIYVSDIEKVVSSCDVKIIQYADDVCIYSIKTCLSDCKDELSRAVDVISKWSLTNGLGISISKTVGCIFSRKRRLPYNNYIELGNYKFPLARSVKFLGLILDKSLTWKEHVNNILKKAGKYLNALRAISHYRWGSDPNVSLLYYRTTIRSVMDFGSIFYGDAKKTILKPLDLLQNKSLRICLGFLRSTPIDVMHSESEELPLPLRRQLLSDRYLIKIMATDSSIYNSICQLNTKVLTHRFWNKKNVPNFVESFQKIAGMKEEVKVYAKIPKFGTRVCPAKLKLNIVFLEDFSHVPEPIRNAALTDAIHTLWPGAYCIYTDGSKIDDRVGCAVYDPQTECSKIYSLPAPTSVYIAEMVAIDLALEYISALPHKKYTILSDCQSVLQKLNKYGKAKENNHIEVSIVEKVIALRETGVYVSFGWVKGHCGLQNNVKADELARVAAFQGEQLNLKLPYKEFYRKLSANVFAKWESDFRHCPKGKFYKGSIKELGISWFKKYVLNKHMVTTICRMKANHTICRAYLCRVGQLENSLCLSCGVLEDSKHIIMSCNKYTSLREAFLSNIKKYMKDRITYEDILFSSKIEVLLILYEFTKEIAKRQNMQGGII